ncbi:MAG: DUF167 domain-containing protein [bacterium]|nr:DUF167 domain-containing protein [bacterium]
MGTMLFVQVKSRSKHPGVVEFDASHYVVAVAEPPVAGAANEAVIRALASHFSIAPSRISLVRGAASRQKVFQIDV